MTTSRRGHRHPTGPTIRAAQAGPAADARLSGWVLLAATLALLALAGCSDHGSAPNGSPDPDPATVSFAAEIQPIFDTNCVGCHGDGGSAGLDLRATATPGSLVNVAATGHTGLRVTPGNAAASVLYLKVEGDPSTGARMPFGGAALSVTQRGLIRDWIAQGALDN
ncbi:hypothetical protein FJ250_06925 [bacterium]|nr:hypothetical protein [bacterium]